jgi:hypothetical protein
VTVAWGALFPARQILFYFVLPVSGQILIYVTIATTLVFALMVGVSHFVPHFAAIGAALFYVRGLAALQTRLKVAQLVRAQKRRSSHLHVVKKGDRDDRPKWLH